MTALSKLQVQNLLSFGEKGVELELRPLNVLIGPNGSGKSNLIEVVGLLNSAPEDLAEPFRETGGVVEWIWKGGSKGCTAIIEATVNVSQTAKRASFTFPSRRRSGTRAPSYAALRYRLEFRPSNYQLEIVDERIQVDALPRASVYEPSPEVFFAYENGRPMLNVRGKRQMLRPEEINPQKSVLSQRKDPEQYPELTEIGRLFASFRFYRDWEFGIGSRAREASPADAPVDFLEESTRNLALMVNRLNDRPETEAELLKYMKTFYADAESIKTTVVGVGQVDLRLQEKSKFMISAARLSDGTLRWMALLTILLHPSPPPLVCLEEPELGLHPDVIRPLAKLLVQASERMQLIVTTHSDALVDELTETPEAVIVCEKEAGSTTLRRLKQQELSSWLEQYTLGELWHKGQIGGTRW
ncbi:MAG: AAA family ATPase [Terriglobia bacterium]|jgi:predicted ATPase